MRAQPPHPTAVVTFVGVASFRRVAGRDMAARWEEERRMERERKKEKEEKSDFDSSEFQNFSPFCCLKKKGIKTLLSSLPSSALPARLSRIRIPRRPREDTHLLLLEISKTSGSSDEGGARNEGRSEGAPLIDQRTFPPLSLSLSSTLRSTPPPALPRCRPPARSTSTSPAPTSSPWERSAPPRTAARETSSPSAAASARRFIAWSTSRTPGAVPNPLEF